MITLAIPTYRRFDLAALCVASARIGTVAPDRVIVVDNSGGHCPPIAGAEVVLGRQPQSVAAAWNDAARLAGDGWLVLANDDISFAPDTLARLLEAAESNPRAAITGAIAGLAFALFALRRAAYAAIGPFDERFAPAYFEDNDYAWRLQLAGWELVQLDGLGASHVGSGTLRVADQAGIEAHHTNFRRCQRRYLAKWGGLPGAEAFTTPFGGEA